MPIIDPDIPFHYPWYVKLFFWNQKRRYGKVLKPAKLWARSPRVFAAIALLYGALDRNSSPVDPALRILITVRVSQLNGCAFCIDINSATALKRGVSEEKLMALTGWEESLLFDEREKAVLSYVEAVTLSGQQPQPSHFEALHKYYDDNGIIELTALIAFQNLSSKFNASLGVEPQGFCMLPDRDEHLNTEDHHNDERPE
ncbi:MAG: carboxymuconolactone decarboxylase family protein [Gammaproteobacteria bacterium]|nr:MAG: carboxymuconolactone decarboxylase family protein [Gammaproteobacteria bacterium]